MDRTVPNSGNEEIVLYMRTYYSLLRSSREVPIRSLIEAHKRINSALHVGAATAEPDLAAFLYSMLRLPDVLLDHVSLVIMGQSDRVFAHNGYVDVEHWESVSAPARRRRAFWNGNDTLALFIASRSDIDDIIPKLTAYQIERDKLQLLLNQPASIRVLETAVANDGILDQTALRTLNEVTGLTIDDLQKVQKVWGLRTASRLLSIATNDGQLSVRLLAGSFAEYKRATRRWWAHISDSLPHICFHDCPIYFTSSNTHSLANLLSGYAQQIEPLLIEFVRSSDDRALQAEYENIVGRRVPSSPDNFLYYILKKYEARYPETIAQRIAHEESVGIRRIPSEHVFDVEAQVIELGKLDPDHVDPRLDRHTIRELTGTQTLIINIDYPLGMAAYQILSEIARNIAQVRGVYIMGKAATLNGRVGDIMIPNVVHDEHSYNTYLFNNCFKGSDLAPYLVYGSILDNQKAITAPGTFLQNHEYMSVFYKEGYTDLEMEAGPYLSCIYEMVRPRRYPHNEIVNLYTAPFEIGILHYASDTPFRKGMNLGTRNLSYEGMDPTYATTIAIMRKIAETENSHENLEQQPLIHGSH